MLWPADYCYFQLFAVLGVADAACANLFFFFFLLQYEKVVTGEVALKEQLV